jgi:4-diphosphocytidyl-2-C-methyl-D-erythritol kinase
LVNFPNAKVNIGLNIIEKRTDGFHNIESIFYPIQCCDALEILPSKSTNFKSSGINIPGSSDGNLCLNAYNLLKGDFDIPPVDIHLLKAIPIGAGLGGGSADGAFTLKLLNEINKLNLGNQQLENYAKKLGSDCAFFIENKPKYCFGKGDEFEEIQLDLSGKYLVMVNPNIHISTAEAYAGITPKISQINIRKLIKKPIQEWRDFVVNDFEKSLFPKYPILGNIKNGLYKLGAEYAAMTGSGSTLYGIFETEINLKIFKDLWTFQKKIN